MISKPYAFLTVLIAALAVTVGAGCGGSDSTGSSTTPASTPPAVTGASGVSRKDDGRAAGAERPGSGASPAQSAASPIHHHDSGGGARQFVQKGGDNSIQEYGSEADGSEFAQAAAALHGYLDAIAAGRWGRACSMLAPGVVKPLAQLAASGHPASCPKVLATLSGPVPVAERREAAIADAGALRIEGDRAFLLFHGAHGQAYFMPMVSVDGRWLPAAISASVLL
jgi:hypothetical protein